jgi:hypothetical protein
VHHKQKPFTNFSIKLLKINLQPAPAWTAILGLFLVILVGLLVGAAPILGLLFPLGSFCVGVFLYRKYPILYVGFTWWLWFLAPLIKRLIDYSSGYATFGNSTLSASLVTSVCFVGLFQRLPEYLTKSSSQNGLPFVLCAGSVIYASIIGAIRQSGSIGLREILLALMSWLGPIAFGFYLYINWRNYPSYRQNIQRIFFWAVIVMGAYGIIQFFLVPDWDRFYLNTIGKDLDFNLGWFGPPEPMKLRIWSTMSTPFSFAHVWVSGLILLWVNSRNPHFVITGLGYLILLLTQVRSGWYVWFLSFLFFSISLKQGKQIRLIVSLVTILIVLVPLALSTTFASDSIERFQTFFNLQKDVSFQGRFNDTADLLNYGLSNFLGVGLLGTYGVVIDQNELGNNLIFKVVDNGYITLLLSLGWFGIIPYLGGIALIFFKLFQKNCVGYSDLFLIAARSIALGAFIGIATTNISFGEGAMNIWCFLGISMAAHEYHSHQLN